MYRIGKLDSTAFAPTSIKPLDPIAQHGGYWQLIGLIQPWVTSCHEPINSSIQKEKKCIKQLHCSLPS